MNYSADLGAFRQGPSVTLHTLSERPGIGDFDYDIAAVPAYVVPRDRRPPVMRFSGGRTEMVVDLDRLAPGEAITFTRETGDRYLTMSWAVPPTVDGEWE